MHRARLLLLVRGQRDLSKGGRACARRREPVPDELLLVETDAPFLSPQEHRGKPNEPAFVRSTAEFLAELRGQTYEQLEQVVESNAALDLPLVSESTSLARASRERMARFGVRPNRELGQNFLVDDNILGVIGRSAELDRRRRRARDRRRARGPERVPRASACATFTWSRRDASSSRCCATRSPPTRTPTSCSATSWTST